MLGMSIGPMVLHILGSNIGALAAIKSTEVAAATMSKRVIASSAKMTLALTAPIAVFAAASVKAFASFDSAMTKSTAIVTDFGGSSRREMEKLAIVLSKKGVQSATELADSYFHLLSAGLSVKDSMASLATVQEFATAGMFSMVDATHLLTESQSALGMNLGTTEQNAKSLLHISNLLNKANRLSHGSVKQFAQALTTQAANAMRTYRVSIEEGMSVLAAFATQGLKAQRAGTLFARMLRLTTQAYERKTSVWKRAGLELFTQEKQWRSFAGIFKDLSDHFKGVADADITSALTNLGFQMRSAQTIMPLLDTGGMLEKFRDAFKEVENVSFEIAQKNLMAFSSQMKILRNNIVSVGISIGANIAPMLEKMSKHIIRLTEHWNNLSNETQRFIIKIATFVALGPPVILIVTGMYTQFKKLFVMMSLITWKMSLVVGAITAVAAAMYTARVIWEDETNKMGSVLKTVFDSVIFPLFDTLLDKIQRSTTALVGFIKEAADAYNKNTDAALKRISPEEFLRRNPIDSVTRAAPMISEAAQRFINSERADPGAVLQPDDKPAEETFMQKYKAQIAKDLESISGLFKGFFPGLFASDAEQEIRKAQDALTSLDATLEESFDRNTVIESKQRRMLEARLQMYKDLRIENAITSKARLDLLELESLALADLAEDEELAMKWFEQRAREAENAADIRGDNFFKGFAAQMEIMKDGMTTLGQAGALVAEQMIDSLTDSMWELVSATDNWDESLKKVARSLAATAGATATRALLQFAITSAIGAAGGMFAPGAGAGGSSFTGGNTPGAGALPANTNLQFGNTGAGSFHGGGIITAHRGTVIRSDERMVKAQVGEGIFTADQMKAIGGLTRDDETQRMLSEIRNKIGPTTVALFDNRDSMEQYLTSKSGAKTVVQVARRHRREING